VSFKLGVSGKPGGCWSSAWTPAILARGGWPHWAIANLTVTAAYFGLGLIVSRFFASYGVFPAPIWLPSGIATVAAMVGGPLMLPGIFLGSFLTNAVLFAPPLHVSIVISLTNALGPVAGAMALCRLRPSRGLFASFPGVIAFLVCTTFLSPAISATGGAIGVTIWQRLDATQFYSTWVNWWLTDSGGALYLAPALILWLGLESEAQSRGSGKPHFERRDLAVWAWVATVSVVLFLTPPLHGTYIRTAFPFLLVVPLSWIALRMSLRHAYSLVSLVAIAATAGTVAGYGPFQNHALANPLQLVGVLVVLLAMNVLTIVALFSERQEAENASKVKSMFLANTSHELRTPLNAIIGYSSLIVLQAAENRGAEKYAEYAGNIKASGEHLLALIDDLLQMSKIEAGRVDLQEETLSLSAVFGDILNVLTLEARAKSVALQADLPGGDISVKADARALRQILLNLVSNSVKFTPSGGQVQVTATVTENGALSLCVADTGIGLPEEALERVFTPFERAHTDGDHQRDGTGLGLPIARGLAALHGGTIALTSSVGRGTTATVMLPANRVVAGRLGSIGAELHGATASA